MKQDYDSIIIGAGVNGLVCANVLAKQGQRVLVLEANGEVGGLAVTREFAPGFKVSAAAHVYYGLHPQVIEQAGLEKTALEQLTQPLANLVINQNKEFILTCDARLPQLLAGSLVSETQMDEWQNFHQQMLPYCDLLASLSLLKPPRMRQPLLAQLKSLLPAMKHYRRLNKSEQRRFLRIIGMNVYDLMDEYLSHDLQKSAICFDAIVGSRLGPRAPNTVFNWLVRQATIGQQASLSQIKGGMGSLSKLLMQTALDHRVEIHTFAKVSKILVENNRAHAVVVDQAESISAQRIITNADLKHTMMELVGAEHLETDVVRRVSHIPTNGSTAKLHLALSQLPESVSQNDEDFNARIIFAPSPDFIERASNAIKYQQTPQDAVLEITLPSYQDASLAPAGSHVMSVLIPYTTYQHEQGWQQQRQSFENHIIEQLECIFPGIRPAIIASELLLPEDIESQFNLTGGHWHHGETGLERAWMLRPTAGFAQYQTSIENLWFCGADAHPGGDVNGIAGLNAAKAVLEQ